VLSENSLLAVDTLIATGYIVPPISKLPFLNIMTDVLLIQVPKMNTKTEQREFGNRITNCI